MRVIFAVDDPTARSLSAALAELGHEPLGFAHGEQAWAAYRAGPPPLVGVRAE